MHLLTYLHTTRVHCSVKQAVLCWAGMYMSVKVVGVWLRVHVRTPLGVSARVYLQHVQYLY